MAMLKLTSCLKRLLVKFSDSRIYFHNVVVFYIIYFFPTQFRLESRKVVMKYLCHSHNICFYEK